MGPVAGHAPARFAPEWDYQTSKNSRSKALVANLPCFDRGAVDLQLTRAAVQEMRCRLKQGHTVAVLDVLGSNGFLGELEHNLRVGKAINRSSHNDLLVLAIERPFSVACLQRPWTLDSPLIRVQENWGRFNSLLGCRVQPDEVASHLGGASIVVFLQHPLFVVVRSGSRSIASRSGRKGPWPASSLG